MKNSIWKILWILLVLCIGILPVQADEPRHGSASDVNPMYESLPLTESRQVISSNGASTYTATTLNQAVTYVRNQMKARAATISFQYSGSDVNIFDTTRWSNLGYSYFCSYLLDLVWAHNGNPTEGDYIQWHYHGYSASWDECSGSGKYNWVLTYNMYYLDSASYVSATDSACASILSSLNLSGKSDYEKLKAIYTWLTANVTYDYSAYDYSSSVPYLKHTAYAALVKHHAVCQGYTTAFYRMALAAGIDCRAIPSVRYNGEGHIWDIAKLGSYYYNLDATWDAGKSSGSWNYFLKNQADFTDDVFHTRNSAYLSSSFMSQYPMASKSYTQVSKISSLKATVSGTTVKLTWSALSGIKNYEIWRSTSASTGFTKIGTTTSAAYNATGQSYGKTYYFKVRALMTNGSYSDYTQVTAAIPNAAVSGLKATVSGTTAKLTWSAFSGRKNYEIWRSTSASSGFTKIGTTTNTAYNPTGLNCGTTYYFKVRALLTNGQYSSYSAVVKTAMPKLAVNGAKATVSGTTAKLSWSAVSGRKTYEIWRSTSATSGFTKIGTTSSTAYNAANLTRGKTWYFKVRALLTTGQYSTFSSVVKASIPQLAVSGLKSTLSGTTVKLTWSAFSGRKNYEIWRSTSASSGFTKIGTTTNTAYNPTGLNCGTTYYFKIRALLTNGQYSNYSAAVKAAVPKLTVGGFKATVSGTTAKLSWSAVSGRKTYEIWRSTSASSGFTKISTTASTAYNPTGLNCGTTYYFKVRALLTNGQYSAFSAAVKAAMPKLAVNGLKATVSGTTAKLSWSAVSGRKIYEIYRSTSSTSGFAKIGTTASTAYNPTGLNCGTTYYYKVRALLTNGQYSTFSAVVKTAMPKLAVSGLKATISGTTAKLTWSAVSGRKSYEIYRSTSATTGFTKIGTATGNAYNATGLSYGKTYYFKVRTLLTTGQYSTFSAAVKAVISLPAVSGFKTTVSGTTAKLTWNKLSGSKSYEIYRSTSSTSGFSKITATTGTAYNASGLSQGKTYYFKIRPLMTNGQYGSFSSAINAVIPNGTWGTCAWYISGGTLTIYPASGSSCTLADTYYNLNGSTQNPPWHGRTDVTRIVINQTVKAGKYADDLFEYMYNLTDISGLSKLDVSNTSRMKWMFYYCTSLTNITPLQKWNVSNETDISFMFYGTDVSCSGLTSWGVSNSLLKYTFCNGSSSLSAADSSASAGGRTVQLSWDSIDGAIVYEIYGSENEESGFREIGTTADTTYEAAGLDSGKTWYFKVRAMLDKDEYSEYLPSVRVVILSDLSAVSSPVDITEECSEDGSTCTLSEKVCTETECTITSKVCVVVGDQKACADPVVTVVPVLTETPTVVITPEISEECSEDGSSCTYSEKVCTETECTVTSKVCAIEGEEKVCSEPVVTVVPVLTETPTVVITPEISEECSEDGSSCTYSEKVCTETECTVTSKVCAIEGEEKVCAEPVVTVVPVLTETPTVVPTPEISEECSADGSSCTYSEKVCTETECTVSSKVCVIVGDQKACADPVVTVVPVLTETPAATETPAMTEEPAATATATPETVVPTEEVSEECSEDGSTCTIYSKVCTGTECTITSKVCVVVGDQKACADPIVTVVPVLTETPAVTETAPAATKDITAEPATTETATAEPTATEETTAEPAATEAASAEPAVTETTTAEPAATDEATAEPAVTETATAEPAATEAATAEPAATEETTAEPAATDAVTAEPSATEEATAEPVATEAATAEPAVTEEATAEPVATEAATAEPAATEEATAEPAAAEAAPAEPTPTEDLTIREISIEDLTEDTISFKALESYIIKPEKLKIVPEAADWADLTFKLDDETVAAFKTTDIEVIKAEGLTINGLVTGNTTLRIQAGDVEKTVTLVITLSEADIQATLEAEAAAQAAAAEPTPAPAEE